MALSNYIPRYTVTDYEQWKGDWELWSGVPVSICPSPDIEHQLLSGELFVRLRKSLEEAECLECTVVQDVDWRVSEDTVLRPDLSIICRHKNSGFIEQSPPMVVEILSDSTRQRDLLYKKDMYEKLGVLCYLIVDPRAKTWSLFMNGVNGFEAASLTNGLSLSPDCKISPVFDGLFEDSRS